MEKLRGPEKLIRTTLGEYLANGHEDIAGVYVIACYPQFGCIYIGQAKVSVYKRLRQHLGNVDEDLGPFLRCFMADACKFRLDILTPPNIKNKNEWIYQAEKALINYFNPWLNIGLNTPYPS